MTQRAKTGDSSIAAAHAPSKPSPVSAAADDVLSAVAPDTVAAPAPIPMTTPMGVRRRRPGADADANSGRMAATGAIRTGRRAGADAANAVTTVPSSSESTTVRVDSTRPPDGRPM